jgi:sugar phosphate isomerase/epimerase
MNIVAASTLAFLNVPFAETLKMINGIGFEGVEIYYEGKHSLPKKEIIDDLSIYDFKTFLHAPFSDLNIASFNQTVLEESKRQIKRSLEVAADVGVELVTVHFGRYSPLGLSYPKAAVERNLESVIEISKFGGSLGIEVAFENAPNGFGAMYGPLDFIERLIEEAGIKITLDVGHANTWEVDVSDFIYRLNSFISHVHLHDNTGESDMHIAFGEGVINHKKVFAAFREIKYKKALCLEMLYEEDLKKSRKKIKSLLDV